MDELEAVWSGLVTFTASHSLASVAAIQFLKSAGVPLPAQRRQLDIRGIARRRRHSFEV
jgi:hypothetical protein